MEGLARRGAGGMMLIGGQRRHFSCIGEDKDVKSNVYEKFGRKGLHSMSRSFTCEDTFLFMEELF